MNTLKSVSILALALSFSLFSCKNDQKEQKTDKMSTKMTDNKTEMGLNPKDFDTLINGEKVGLYWIENDSIKAAFTNYGGRIVGLWVPDKNGKMTDVVVGFNSTKAYLNSTEPYFGATIGRVGNRIAKGKFTLDGKEYSIPTNNNGNSLHGGNKGFQAVVWKAEQPDEQTLVLTYRSPDMEEGFPGNLDVTVTYSATSDRGIKMEYEAKTDKATPVNLTNHAFFNLNGEGSGSILEHKVKIDAVQFTPVDEGLIPLGSQERVAGSPFDFMDLHTIGERIDSKNEQLGNGKGYDHNFVLDNKTSNGLEEAATVIGDKSGIAMTVLTEEPGLQFYSGNFMQGKNTFKAGAKDEYRTAFAMETQHFPDSPNQRNFPSITLEPGSTYRTVSEYRFSIEEE